MGPMSTAERQKRYRERALRDPDGTLLTRLQVMLSPNAAANLERITARTGQTKRQAVEKALQDLAKALQCNELEVSGTNNRRKGTCQHRKRLH